MELENANNTLFLDTSAGIAGDMFVGMMIDLGADKEGLEKALMSLKTDDFSVSFKKVEKCGITATKYDVTLKEHVHCHRNLGDIEKIIDGGELSESVKALSKKIFRIVAEAEGKVHGKPINEVHFHEVGAADSIADTVAAAWCLDNLKINKVFATALTVGSGTVNCAHGIMPVPAPATAEILTKYKIPFKLGEEKGEMVTPTGAAIAAAICESFGDIPSTSFSKVGYGAGNRDFSYPNVLRGFLKENSNCSDTVTVLETNLDDTTGEDLGICINKLFKVGVLDAFFTPIFMKKNRPGYMLTAICDKKTVEEACELIFENTGSIGIRKRTTDRVTMQRDIINISTKFGDIPCKFSSYKTIKKVKPEADFVEKISKENGISRETVRNEVENKSQSLKSNK